MGYLRLGVETGAKNQKTAEPQTTAEINAETILTTTNSNFPVDDRTESEYGSCATEKALAVLRAGRLLTRLTSL